MYQDSFGNVAPASAKALAAGTLPPPINYCLDCVPPATCTTVTCGYEQPNILMIMVDQMRAPRWVPSNWQSSIFPTYLPNIYGLQNQAYVFPNVFVAATACTPCRATILTGLYSQQTGVFVTLSEGGSQPRLIPLNADRTVGYPTIGNVLSQDIVNGTPYQTVWIGKWHLSANDGAGSNWPSAYGFTDSDYCIPNTNPNAYGSVAYPSPDGSPNEGTEGILLTGTPPGTGTSYPGGSTPDDLLDDGGIADAFGLWVAHAKQQFPTTPWFAAVSFVNPHDISHFPYAYGLTPPPPSTDFGAPSNPPLAGYEIPPTGGNGTVQNSDEYLPALLDAYTTAPTGPLPSGGTPWNNSNDPKTYEYGNFYSYGVGSPTQQYGKPTEQWYFQNTTDQADGSIKTTNGWLTFLNYYLWMQSCVDDQVGRVLLALQESDFADNTAIIFFSDHGDYGGSHNMHRKGGGLYDEVMNVPLYIRLVGQLPGTVPVPYLCSTVDILPFLYWLVLGNDTWRNNPNDLVNYLAGREAIHDFIFSTAPQQRRLSNIPLASPVNGQTMQPYVLHTCDEDLSAIIPGTKNCPTPGTPAPSHAIAFRTVDISVNANQAPPYGGGKLGIYSYWPSPARQGDDPPNPAQTQPLLTGTPATPAQEFEFYYYSPNGSLSPNPQEVGNQAFYNNGGTPAWETEASAYNSAFGAVVSAELYAIPSQSYIQNAYNTTAWSGTALGNFLSYAQTVPVAGSC
jgi:arylsulfatase A-like enzyme